jgi:serine protease inhibitor
MVAAEKTRDKIREVLSAEMLSELTRVLLANAIYFKARWEQQFVEEQTRPSPFTLARVRRNADCAGTETFRILS